MKVGENQNQSTKPPQTQRTKPKESKPNRRNRDRKKTRKPTKKHEEQEKITHDQSCKQNIMLAHYMHSTSFVVCRVRVRVRIRLSVVRRSFVSCSSFDCRLSCSFVGFGFVIVRASLKGRDQYQFKSIDQSVNEKPYTKTSDLHRQTRFA